MREKAKKRRRASLSLPIIRTSRKQHRAGNLTLGTLLSELGEASFGWSIVILALVNLLPLPPGFTLVTALPLLWATAQMMLGYPFIRLPGVLAGLRLDPRKLRRTVLRLRPITRRLERLLRHRYTEVFSRKNEPVLGLLLFVISFALFLPLPLSGWFPAISLFIVGIGLIEQDGLVVILGLVGGALSVVLTGVVLVWVVLGAEAMIH